jgi:hypothetical protein
MRSSIEDSSSAACFGAIFRRMLVSVTAASGLVVLIAAVFVRYPSLGVRVLYGDFELHHFFMRVPSCCVVTCCIKTHRWSLASISFLDTARGLTYQLRSCIFPWPRRGPCFLVIRAIIGEDILKNRVTHEASVTLAVRRGAGASLSP